MTEFFEDAPILIQGISKTYEDRHVLRDINLSIAAGEFFGVIGPNGAGKTTLLEIIEGIRKPNSGSVSILGLQTFPRNAVVARKLGIQTQDPAFFHMHTALEHLETMAGIYGVSRKRAQVVLFELGLDSVASTMAKKLSGGAAAATGNCLSPCS